MQSTIHEAKVSASVEHVEVDGCPRFDGFFNVCHHFCAGKQRVESASELAIALMYCCSTNNERPQRHRDQGSPFCNVVLLPCKLSSCLTITLILHRSASSLLCKNKPCSKNKPIPLPTPPKTPFLSAKGPTFPAQPEHPQKKQNANLIKAFYTHPSAQDSQGS